MINLTPKIDNNPPPDGQLTAAEFNDARDDAQNLVTESGQTLTPGVGEDNRQMIKAVSIGGSKLSRTDTQTAQVGEIVVADNSSGTVTINLPPLSELFTNATVYFEQEFNTRFSLNNLIVGRNGQTIGGLSEDMTVTTDDIKFKLSWNGGTWVPIKTELVGTTLI